MLFIRTSMERVWPLLWNPNFPALLLRTQKCSSISRNGRGTRTPMEPREAVPRTRRPNSPMCSTESPWRTSG
ncbi:hypothetical protein M9458_012171, partial [Cirrhinus mrigala]